MVGGGEGWRYYGVSGADDVVIATAFGQKVARLTTPQHEGINEYESHQKTAETRHKTEGWIK